MKNLLLCTLGKSPMIAIEAFLMAKNKIDEVHLFSNIQDTYKDIIPYFNELGIPITITLLDNFTDIQSENDHLPMKKLFLDGI